MVIKHTTNTTAAARRKKKNYGSNAGVKIKQVLLIDEDDKQQFILSYTSPLTGGRDTLHQKKKKVQVLQCCVAADTYCEMDKSPSCFAVPHKSL